MNDMTTREKSAIRKELVDALVDALDYYADPETYFAILFLSDPPCGDFMNDFDQTSLGWKPGAKARSVINLIVGAGRVEAE